jgi:hypothetical protein
MRRLLLTVVAAIAAPVLIATLYLWQRSYRTADTYSHTTAANYVHVISSHAGALQVVQVDRTPLGAAAASSLFTHTPLAPGATWQDPYASFTHRIEWSAAGFALISGQAPAAAPAGVITLLGTSTYNSSGTIILPGSNVYTGSAQPGLSSSGNSGAATTPQSIAGGNIALGNANTLIVGSGRVNSINFTSAATVGSGMVYGGGGTFTGLTLYTEQQQALVLPYWFLAICFAIAPALWLASTHHRRRLRKRLRTNHCQQCGYDLRASTDRCPECGTAIPAPAQPAAAGVVT